MPNLRSTFKLCPACEKRARLNHAQPARNGHFQIIPNLRAALPNCAQSARSGHFQVVPGSREADTSTLCLTLELHFHIVLNLRSTSKLCPTRALLPNCAQPARSGHVQIVLSCAPTLCELRVHIVPNPRSACKFCPTREKRARLQIVRSPAVLSNCAQSASCASKLRTVQDIFAKTHKK